MSSAAIKAAAFVHHVAMTSPNPAQLAAFYADALDMGATQYGDHWHVLGPGRRLLLSEGPARGLVHVGFAVRDRAALFDVQQGAAAQGLAPRPYPTALFEEAAFAVTDPDGNAVVFGLAGQEQPAKGLRGTLQHVTFATQDIARFETFYAQKLGFAVSDYVVRDDGQVMTVFLRSNHEHHTIGVFFQHRSGVDHIAFEAAEWGILKDWCDRFGDRTISLDWGPGRHGPGNNLFAFITDPDGNWLEISAELEVIYDRPANTWRHEERTLNLWGQSRLRA